MKLSRWHFGLRGEQSLTMGIPRSISATVELSGVAAVGETGVSQLFGGRGDRWIAGPRRVYPFSKDICFCALQFR